MKFLERTRTPEVWIRVNSRRCRTREARGKVPSGDSADEGGVRSASRVTRLLLVDRGGQALATLGPAAAQDVLALLGGHALPEPVGALAANARWLKCPFHGRRSERRWFWFSLPALSRTDSLIEIRRLHLGSWARVICLRSTWVRASFRPPRKLDDVGPRRSRGPTHALAARDFAQRSVCTCKDRWKDRRFPVGIACAKRCETASAHKPTPPG